MLRAGHGAAFFEMLQMNGHEFEKLVVGPSRKIYISYDDVLAGGDLNLIKFWCDQDPNFKAEGTIALASGKIEVLRFLFDRNKAITKVLGGSAKGLGVSSGSAKPLTPGVPQVLIVAVLNHPVSLQTF